MTTEELDAAMAESEKKWTDLSRRAARAPVTSAIYRELVSLENAAARRHNDLSAEWLRRREAVEQ